MARKLGVSASYLSQIKNGKRPASQKVLSKVFSNVKQQIDDNTPISYNFKHAGVVELADAADLKFQAKLLKIGFRYELEQLC